MKMYLPRFSFLFSFVFDSDQFPQFTNFWKPVCMLDINIWQKWMHTHRIGVIVEHDHPLPKNLHVLHVTSTSGRSVCQFMGH